MATSLPSDPPPHPLTPYNPASGSSWWNALDCTARALNGLNTVGPPEARWVLTPTFNLVGQDESQFLAPDGAHALPPLEHLHFTAGEVPLFTVVSPHGDRYQILLSAVQTVSGPLCNPIRCRAFVKRQIA